MLKRKTYITVIIFIITLAGSAWAIWTIIRYTFYNPMEPVKIADIPSDALTPPEYEFVAIIPPDIPPRSEIKIVMEPTLISGSHMRDIVFPILIEKEKEYSLKARTRSAFDPVKDETLRGMLRELARMKEGNAIDRFELGLMLFDELAKTAGDTYFKSYLFEMLMKDSLMSSMENPELYPLRLAEVKSDFYESKMNTALKMLTDYDSAFNAEVVQRLDVLRNKQMENEDTKILLIRDYLLGKTSAIEAEVRGNHEPKGDGE
jgi:hypothetical protein